MSVPEVIPLTKIQKYANNDMFVNVVSIIKPVKSALYMKEGVDKKSSVAATYDIYNKNACYLSALQNLGITKKKLKK